MGKGGGGGCLTAAFMSYIGPFLSNYREDMVSKVWLAEVSTTMWVRVGGGLFDCCIHVIYRTFLDQLQRRYGIKGLVS